MPGGGTHARTGTCTSRGVVASIEFGFQVIPRTSGTAAMTKVGSRVGFDIEFVQIGKLTFGRFGAKGTFPNHDVGSVTLELQSMRLTIFGNDLRTDIERHIVTTHIGAVETFGVVKERR